MEHTKGLEQKSPRKGKKNASLMTLIPDTSVDFIGIGRKRTDGFIEDETNREIQEVELPLSETNVFETRHNKKSRIAQRKESFDHLLGKDYDESEKKDFLETEDIQHSHLQIYSTKTKKKRIHIEEKESFIKKPNLQQENVLIDGNSSIYSPIHSLSQSSILSQKSLLSSKIHDSESIHDMEEENEFKSINTMETNNGIEHGISTTEFEPFQNHFPLVEKHQECFEDEKFLNRQIIPSQMSLSYMKPEYFSIAEFHIQTCTDRTLFQKLSRESFSDMSIGFTFGQAI
jgi:hypothetical protein